MSKSLWLLTGVCLIISACSLAPDYERPVVNMSDSYHQAHTDGETIAKLKWSEVFQDPDLQSLISEALNNNRSLAVSMARIEEARAIVGVARADQFPRLDVQGSATRSQIGTIYPLENNFNLYGALSWELDIWAKLRNATEASRARLLETTYADRALTISVISTVADLYFALIDVDLRIKTATETLKNRVEATRIINARFSKGVVGEIDLNQAQIEEFDVAASLASLMREQGLTENALRVVLGRTGGHIERNHALSLLGMPKDLPVGIPANVLARRPDLLALEERIKSELALEGVAQANRLPSINILGTLGLASTRDSDFFSSDAKSWSVGGSLFSPIIDWQQNKSRVEAQQARVMQAKASYEDGVINALREVEDSLVEAKTFFDEYEQRDKQIKAAANATKLSRARYDNGLSPYLEVLDVERSLYSAQLSASFARRRYINSLVRLYKALGGGWEA